MRGAGCKIETEEVALILRRVDDQDNWRRFVVQRASRAPVHVVLASPNPTVAELIDVLATEPGVYAVYLQRDLATFIPADLIEDGNTPIFLVSNENEAVLFAARLVAGDLTVLQYAVNGDVVLYRFLEAHQA